MKKYLKNSIPSALREKLQIFKGKKIYIDKFNITKSVFVHIPKCAGTSIGKAIYNDAKIGHATAKDYYYTNKSKFIEYYKFTIMRDPIERCYSAYNYLKSEKCTENDKKFFKKHVAKFNNFDDFVINGLKKYHVQKFIHFKPQIDFILFNGVIMVDQIFSFNKLNQNYTYLKTKFKIKSKLKMLNTTKNIKKRNVISLSKKILNKTYKNDCLIFKKLKKRNYLSNLYKKRIKNL